MIFLSILEILNYCLVLVFGLLLSAEISGGWANRQQRNLVFILCPLLLMIQGICWLLWGVTTVRHLYPLIVHIPLVLVLTFALKKRLGISLVSVCTAYFLCQLPRWVDLTVTAITGLPLAGEISYTLFILPLFFLLRRFFVSAIHDAMTYSSQLLTLFGSLPLVYYIFDYVTVVYADVLTLDVQAINEFLPTALILFYVLFITAYHAQMQKRVQAELQSSIMEVELKQSHLEMEALRRAETQTAIYQHDMHHHLTAIQGLLTAQKPEQAMTYIQKTQDDVAAISPKHFCKNELVNLLCSSFSAKSQKLDIQLNINVKLPELLPISDTELCSVISNGLENAFNAVAYLDSRNKWVNFYCEVAQNKLLIEIKNPYADLPIIRDGIPISQKDGHGYGCLSIRTITQAHRGLCTFEPENGIFTLRVVLPL